jgi:hypothetical protein
MQDKRLGIVIGGLAIVLILLVAINNVLNGKSSSPSMQQTNESLPSPTLNIDENSIPVKRIGQSDPYPDPLQKQYDYSFLKYNYPIEYEGLEIDFSTGQNRMDIYYSGDRAVASRTLKKFFAQFGFEDPMQANVQVYMQELRQPNE